jgi:hypothetical protein
MWNETQPEKPICSPSTSKSAVEKSFDSVTWIDPDVRPSVIAISVVRFSSRLRKTSASTRSRPLSSCRSTVAS